MMAGELWRPWCRSGALSVFCSSSVAVSALCSLPDKLSFLSRPQYSVPVIINTCSELHKVVLFVSEYLILFLRTFLLLSTVCGTELCWCAVKKLLTHSLTPAAEASRLGVSSSNSRDWYTHATYHDNSPAAAIATAAPARRYTISWACEAAVDIP